MPGTGVYPGATFLPFLSAPSPSYVDGYPFRGVLHTTQSTGYTPSQTMYYGHTNPPHFTVARLGANGRVFQHYSINNGARALENLAGGVETNRACAIQIEIAWKAENIGALPAVIIAVLHDLMRWIEASKGVQRHAPPFFPESQAAGSGSASRMSAQTWRTFNGWCGHQHVPENVHWDPGPLNIAPLLAP